MITEPIFLCILWNCHKVQLNYSKDQSLKQIRPSLRNCDILEKPKQERMPSTVKNMSCYTETLRRSESNIKIQSREHMWSKNTLKWHRKNQHEHKEKNSLGSQQVFICLVPQVCYQKNAYKFRQPFQDTQSIVPVTPKGSCNAMDSHLNYFYCPPFHLKLTQPRASEKAANCWPISSDLKQRLLKNLWYAPLPPKMQLLMTQKGSKSPRVSGNSCRGTFIPR